MDASLSNFVGIIKTKWLSVMWHHLKWNLLFVLPLSASLSLVDSLHAGIWLVEVLSPIWSDTRLQSPLSRCQGSTQCQNVHTRPGDNTSNTGLSLVLRHPILVSDWPRLASARAAGDNSPGSDPRAYQGRAWDSGCHELGLKLSRILSRPVE